MSASARSGDLGGGLGSTLSANASRLSGAIAAGLRPPALASVAAWSARHRRFPEGAPLSGAWRHETAPYLVEVLERLSPFDPAGEVTLMKCAQSGGSAAAETWIGYIADVAPGPTLYVQATQAAAAEWARNKLWPMIESTPRLDPARGGAVLAQGEGGSTRWQIQFRGSGYLALAGANSAASLAQRTLRYVIEDGVDQFPDDLEGQGAPEAMIEARMRPFQRLGLAKRLKIGTPTIRGGSKIEAAYARSDRRRFYFKCAACGSRFDPVWEPKDGGARHLQWPVGRPQAAVMFAPCCRALLRHDQKPAMSLVDGWLATAPIEGRSPPRVLEEAEFQRWRGRDLAGLQPGYHVTGLISAFETWGGLAAKFVAAGQDASRRKAWVMLDLGEPFDPAAEVPAASALDALRECGWGPERRFPPGPAVATMGVDVQGDGVYYEIVGWGPEGLSWALEAGFLPGPTEAPGEGAWRALEDVARRPVIYAGGCAPAIDRICVDAGYHAAAARAFCKGAANRLPVLGRAGWTLPVLSPGRSGAYLVGTFGVKLEIYRRLSASVQARASPQIAAGLQGRCRFGEGLPADYFAQLTAEALLARTVGGAPRREWRQVGGRPNHYLDCRVYNHAAAEALGLAKLTPVEWRELLRRRGPARA